MVAVALVALVASAGAMLTVPVAVRRMIDHGFSGADGVFMDMYFAMLIVIGLVLAVASAGRMYAVNWLGERVVADLRAQVFGHLATLGPAFYETTHSGEVMSRLTADTTQIKGAAGSALSQALRNTIMLAGALVMMFVTSPTLTALALAAIPAIVFPLLAYGRAVQRLSRAAQDRLADASAYAADNLGAVRAMAAFGQEGAVSRRFAEAVERAFAAARDRLLARAGLTAIAIFLVVASVVGVLWFGSRLVISGEMTGGRLGQFILYAVFAAGAMAELAEVWGELAQAAGATERLLELLDTRPEVRAPAAPKALPEPPLGTVSFKGVHFAYPDKAGRVGTQWRELRGGGGRDGGPGRTIGSRQEHDLQPDPAFLRSTARQRRDRWPAGHRRRSAGAQIAHRTRAPGGGAVRRHDPGEHPLRTVGRQRRRGAAGRRGRAGRHVHLGTSAGIRNTSRRARRDLVGWTAPAHSARPRRAARCALSCCSTRRPARSMRKARLLYSVRWGGSCRAARRW